MKKSTVFVVLLIFMALFSSAHAQFGEVVYEVEGMDEVSVQNVEYRTVDGTPFTMDVYYPPGMESISPAPVVILVNGARDSRVQPFVGVQPKDFDTSVSWARLIAASGLISVLYESEQPDDLIELVAYILENAESLKIDPNRIGTMANSSNGTAAISYIMQPERTYIRAAVFYYCDMITPDGQYNNSLNDFYENFPRQGDRGFYLTTELEPIEKLRRDLPVLVVRTSRHNGENPTIDHFVAEALERDAALTLINYNRGRHGFDYSQDNERSREIIEFTLEFLASNLDAG